MSRDELWRRPWFGLVLVAPVVVAYLIGLALFLTGAIR